MKKEPKQGDIYFCNLGKFCDSEQGGIRPVLIISNNFLNNSSTNVVVCPITHRNKKRNSICHYVLYKKDYPFFTYDENIVLTENILHISINKLERKLGKILQKDLMNIIKIKENVFIEV